MLIWPDHGAMMPSSPPDSALDVYSSEALMNGSEVHGGPLIHGEDMLESLFFSLDQPTHLMVNLYNGSDEIFPDLLAAFRNYLRAFWRIPFCSVLLSIGLQMRKGADAEGTRKKVIRIGFSV
jgi:hypothetical protein